MDSQHYEGKGCICFARSQGDCACDADWTPKEVYTLRKRVAELENVSQKLIENSVISEHYPKYLDELEKLLTKGGSDND
jgi:hypothetical protein